jgi:hypothetical protein
VVVKRERYSNNSAGNYEDNEEYTKIGEGRGRPITLKLLA